MKTYVWYVYTSEPSENFRDKGIVDCDVDFQLVPPGAGVARKAIAVGDGWVWESNGWECPAGHKQLFVRGSDYTEHYCVLPKASSEQDASSRICSKYGSGDILKDYDAPGTFRDPALEGDCWWSSDGSKTCLPGCLFGYHAGDDYAWCNTVGVTVKLANDVHMPTGGNWTRENLDGEAGWVINNTFSTCPNGHKFKVTRDGNDPIKAWCGSTV